MPCATDRVTARGLPACLTWKSLAKMKAVFRVATLNCRRKTVLVLSQRGWTNSRERKVAHSDPISWKKLSLRSVISNYFVAGLDFVSQPSGLLSFICVCLVVASHQRDITNSVDWLLPTQTLASEELCQNKLRFVSKSTIQPTCVGFAKAMR